MNARRAVRAAAGLVLAATAVLLVPGAAHADPTPAPTASDPCQMLFGTLRQACQSASPAAAAPAPGSGNDPCQLLPVGTLRDQCESAPPSADPQPIGNANCDLLIGQLKQACEQVPPPDLAAATIQWISWSRYLGEGAGVLGLGACGIAMMIGRRNRSHAAAEAAGGLVWILSALGVIGVIASIVTVATGVG